MSSSGASKDFTMYRFSPALSFCSLGERKSTINAVYDQSVASSQPAFGVDTPFPALRASYSAALPNPLLEKRQPYT